LDSQNQAQSFQVQDSPFNYNGLEAIKIIQQQLFIGAAYGAVFGHADFEGKIGGKLWPSSES
jgi:hypothetical protein